MSLTLASIATLRVLVGIAGFGYSLYARGWENENPDTKDFNKGKLFEAVYGGSIGNLIYDFLKGGATDTAGLINKLNAQGVDELNHDLQRAARKAQLMATSIACQSCLANLKIDRAGYLSKFKNKIFLFKDEDIEWLNAVNKNLKAEIEALPEAVFDQDIDYSEVFNIFDKEKVVNEEHSAQEFSDKIKEENLREIRNNFYSKLSGQIAINFSRSGYDLLEDAIKNGWDELKVVNDEAGLIKLDIANLSKNQHGKKYDWFQLVCLLFNEEFKTNPKIQAAIQKRELLEIKSLLLKLIDENKQNQNAISFSGNEYLLQRLLAENKETIVHLDSLKSELGKIENLLSEFDDENKRNQNWLKLELFDIKSFAARDAQNFSEILDSVGTIENKLDNVEREILDFREENLRLFKQVIDVTKEVGEEIKTHINDASEEIKKLIEADKALTPEERAAKEKQIAEDYLEQQIREYPIGEIVGEIYPHDKFFVDRIDEKRDLADWLTGEENIVVIKGVSGDGKTALMTEVLREIVPDAAIDHQKVKGILTFYFRHFSGKVLDVNLLDICKKADARLAKDGLKFGFALQYEEFRKTNPLDIPEQLILNLCSALNSLGDIWIIFDNFESALENGQIRDKEIEYFVRAGLNQTHLRFLITSQVLPQVPGVNNIRQCNIGDLPTGYAKDFLVSKGRELKANNTDCGLAEATDEQFDTLFSKLFPSPISLISFTAYLETVCDTDGKVFTDVLADDTLFAGFADFDDKDKNKGARVLIRRQFDLLSDVEQLILKALSIFPNAIEFSVLQAVLPLSLEKEILLSPLKSNSLVRKSGRNLYELLPLPKEVISKQFEQNEKSEHTISNLKAAAFYRSIHKLIADCYTLEDFDTYFKEIEHYYQAGFYEQIVKVINEIIHKTNPLGLMNETLERSRKIQDKLDNNPQIQANNYVNIGLALDISGRLNEAIVEYDKAITTYEDLVNRQRRKDLLNYLAGSYVNKGIALRNLGRLVEAITEYDKAIEIREELVNRQGRTESANKLANVYLNKGVALAVSRKLNEAINEFAKAIKILEELVNQQGRKELASALANAYLNKGNAFNNLEKSNEAIYETDKAIEIFEELVNRQGCRELASELAAVYLNKGVALEYNNDSISAIAIFSLAIDLWEQDLKSGSAHNLPKLVKAFRHRIKSFIKLEDWQNIADDAVFSLMLFTTFTQDENFSEHFKRQIGAEFHQIMYQLKQLSENDCEKILAIADEFGQTEEPPVLFGELLRGWIEQIQ